MQARHSIARKAQEKCAFFAFSDICGRTPHIHHMVPAYEIGLLAGADFIQQKQPPVQQSKHINAGHRLQQIVLPAPFPFP